MGVAEDFKNKFFLLTEAYILEHQDYRSGLLKSNLLHQAIEAGRKDLVRDILIIIQRNTDPKNQALQHLLFRGNAQGITPLYLAAMLRKHELFDFIVQQLPPRTLAVVQDFQYTTGDRPSKLVISFKLPLKSLLCFVNKICDGTWDDLSQVLYPMDQIPGANKRSFLQIALEEKLSTLIEAIGNGLQKEEITGFSDDEVLGLSQALPNHPHHALMQERNKNSLQFEQLLKNDELPKIVALFGGMEGLVSKITSEAPANAAEILGHVALLVGAKSKAIGDSKKIAQLQASLESFRSGTVKSIPSSSATYKKPATEKQGLLAASSSRSNKYGI